MYVQCHVCAYLSTFMCLSVCLCAGMCVYVTVCHGKSVYICESILMCLCVRLSMHMCVHVCMPVCLCCACACWGQGLEGVCFPQGAEATEQSDTRTSQEVWASALLSKASADASAERQAGELAQTPQFFPSGSSQSVKLAASLVTLAGAREKESPADPAF